MGGDIAAWCALRGLGVTLQDRELKLIEPALARARGLFEKRLSTPAERAAALQRLQRGHRRSGGVAGADVVIEAIFEDLDAKRALYAAAEPLLRPGALLASNTSSLTLESLAATLSDPGRLVGLHFFNPVAQMPLVEVVHSPATRPEALAVALAFTRRIDKLPLPCRSSPGFLVNRVLFPYLYEALHAAGEGKCRSTRSTAPPSISACRWARSSCAMSSAWTCCCTSGKSSRASCIRNRPPSCRRCARWCSAHKLGRKSGQGFYRWHDGKVVRESGRSGHPAGDGAASETSPTG